MKILVGVVLFAEIVGVLVGIAAHAAWASRPTVKLPTLGIAWHRYQQKRIKLARLVR